MSQVEKRHAGNTLAAVLAAKKSTGLLYCPKGRVVVSMGTCKVWIGLGSTSINCENTMTFKGKAVRRSWFNTNKQPVDLGEQQQREHAAHSCSLCWCCCWWCRRWCCCVLQQGLEWDPPRLVGWTDTMYFSGNFRHMLGSLMILSHLI